MSFYGQLSQYYDEIFPVGKDEMRFVRGLLSGKKRILDMGCGNGNKTAELAGDAQTVGFDANPGMIDAANRLNARPNIRYMVLEMVDVGQTFPAASFDAALCLGNTLAHLTDTDALQAAFEQTRMVLEEGGEFILQILNYDRILDNNVTSLPVIDAKHVRFIRNYEWRNGDMHFVTELEVKNGGTYHNDVVLQPIRKRELAEALEQAGFSRIDYFGGYLGIPYDKDSFHLIARAIAK